MRSRRFPRVEGNTAKYFPLHFPEDSLDLAKLAIFGYLQ